MAFSTGFLEEYASMKIALGLLGVEVWFLLIAAVLIGVALNEYRKWLKSRSPKKAPKPERENGLLFDSWEVETKMEKFPTLPKNELMYVVFELEYRKRAIEACMIMEAKNQIFDDGRISLIETIVKDAWGKIREGNDKESVKMEVRSALDASVEEKMDDI